MQTEWIMLADHAETINNKLYLLGGGWQAFTVNTLPYSHKLAVAVSFTVPWDKTDQQHDIEIEVVDEDGGSHGMIQGQVEVSRPPGVPVGQHQRIQMGVNMDFAIEKLGRYVAVSYTHLTLPTILRV